MPRLSLLINLMHPCWIKQYNLWIIVPSNFLRNNQPMVILLFLYKYTNVKMLFLPITYIWQPNRKMRIELVVISAPLASPNHNCIHDNDCLQTSFPAAIGQEQTDSPASKCMWLVESYIDMSPCRAPHYSSDDWCEKVFSTHKVTHSILV